MDTVDDGMRSSKYDEKLLGPIVASSRSFAEVMRKLGLVPNAGNHRMISAHIRRCGLDTSHFGGKFRTTIERISREQLANIVASSTSLAQVLASLGLPTEGRAHHELKRTLAKLDIDISHMRGQGWSRGETASSHPSVARVTAKQRLSDDELFVLNGPQLGGRRIIKRLLARGWPYACALCGISEWRGRPLVLHLDHINGDSSDHRLENLRMLCPNCHSQTDTYCRRVRIAPSRASESRAVYSCYTSSRTRAWRNWYPR